MKKADPVGPAISAPCSALIFCLTIYDALRDSEGQLLRVYLNSRGIGK